MKIWKAGLPRRHSAKESACQCRKCKRCRFSPWVGRSPGVDNGNPHQDFYLENSMDRGPWQATVHSVSKSQTWLSMRAYTHTHNLKSTLTNQVGKIQSVPSTWSLRWLCSLSPILLFTKIPWLNKMNKTIMKIENLCMLKWYGIL